MSASAEVYVSITMESPDRQEDVVLSWLKDKSFPTTGKDFDKMSLESGDIYQVRGWSVDYSVFDEEFPRSLVQHFMQERPEADVEVYVYNLDREADASYSTAIGMREEEPQGCRYCGNVDHKCACTGGVRHAAY